MKGLTCKLVQMPWFNYIMQYITIDEKMSIDMPCASMKTVQSTIHKCIITWPKKICQGMQAWNKTCIEYINA